MKPWMQTLLYFLICLVPFCACGGPFFVFVSFDESGGAAGWWLIFGAVVLPVLLLGLSVWIVPARPFSNTIWSLTGMWFVVACNVALQLLAWGIANRGFGGIDSGLTLSILGLEAIIAFSIVTGGGLLRYIVSEKTQIEQP